MLQNSPPTRAQLIWVAVLDAESLVSFGSHTALELAGFVGFAQEAADIHLIVPRGAEVTPLPASDCTSHDDSNRRRSSCRTACPAQVSSVRRSMRPHGSRILDSPA